MIPRYLNSTIDTIWSDAARVGRWDKVELAVIDARVQLGLVQAPTYQAIKTALENNPTDIAWWLARDKEVGHDLNAYIDERRRYLAPELQSLFHKDLTSFDTEEAAMALALIESAMLIEEGLKKLQGTLADKALVYRYQPFLERTHGQWAKLRSFGGRFLTWLAPLDVARRKLQQAVFECRSSRIAGAIGNYGGELSPEIERRALDGLGLKPFYGATQIIPRIVYAPLAQALRLLCEELCKIALDIRLAARSGKPLCQEPFGKKQKGSSAMPHKKNTILTEQMKGMARLAARYEQAIVEGIETWEARAIEQSCVERVAWPDLFHVAMRMLSVMQNVIGDLAVYPDHMLQEIVDARGTYASDEAKNFLAGQLGARGIESEVAYRIVQLASFNAFEPKGFWAEVRRELPHSLEYADTLLARAVTEPPPTIDSIRDVIKGGVLEPSAKLEIPTETVAQWNELLRELFSSDEMRGRWDELFKPSYLLKSESHLYAELLGA